MSANPTIYEATLNPHATIFSLNDANAKYLTTVLRMRTGDAVNITNGKGLVGVANLADIQKKNVSVAITEVKQQVRPIAIKAMGVALLKNTGRYEWFLEKATELGITHIFPLITKNTIAKQAKMERWQQILVSAMLQSGQYYLPELADPTTIENWINKVTNNINFKNQYVAYCGNEFEKSTLQAHLSNENLILLIGPEGDFTKHEIDLLINNNFSPVSLGNTRLRTETAAVKGAVLLTQL